MVHHRPLRRGPGRRPLPGREAAGLSGEGQRKVGLVGATGVGVGAIVGGGIFVLVGTAFESAGPAAILAFALNGFIAILTALSFAEMSTSFPVSGGAYAFAKRVLSIRAAFAVGWVIWFAYIVAGVLYALGFAEYAALAVSELLRAADIAAPEWLTGRPGVLGLALLASGGYTVSLLRTSSGGGQWATIGKVVIFVGIVLAGGWAVLQSPEGTIREGMSPFLGKGTLGLVTAMGFTFIALQGFDLIATIAGEVKNPRRVIPRAMLLSLGAALVIYLPLLFVTSTVGREPGVSIAEAAAANPETLMASSVERYLGAVGYWFVIIAAILSTLSALQANLLASSRVALSMARDRTLPRALAASDEKRGTPKMAIYASALTLFTILLIVPDVAAAGAAASLIFLLSFALAHLTAYLARKRRRSRGDAFQTPWFPLVPVVGGVACVGLAIFQAVAVPSAGQVLGLWLGIGVFLYYALFAGRAKAVDAFSEAADPSLARMRGRVPLVLVPVANPASAPAMMAVASALAPMGYGRVLLLSVLRRPEKDSDAEKAIGQVEAVVRATLTTSLASGQAPETMVTISATPWAEIARVARTLQCESVLLGLTELREEGGGGAPKASQLESLLNDVERDVVILRAPRGFTPTKSNRILVPIGGRSSHDILRARLLGALSRNSEREITFFRVFPTNTPEAELEQRRTELQRFAEEEAPPGSARAEVVTSDEPIAAIIERAGSADLVVLGLMRHKGKRLFGEVALRIASRIEAATILISRSD